MKYFIRHSNARTLLLIDEFGTGTEPQIGGAIAEATLERFNRNGAFGVITTHYTNLKHYAEDAEGIVNGAMLYDRQQLRPLFRLEIGRPGSSFAVEIARKIGLPRTSSPRPPPRWERNTWTTTSTCRTSCATSGIGKTNANRYA